MLPLPDNYDGTLRLLPRTWLKSWFNGADFLSEQTPAAVEVDKDEGSVVDLTGEEAPAQRPAGVFGQQLFDCAPDYTPYLCKHKTGICPSKAKNCKLVSDEAYTRLMSTVSADFHIDPMSDAAMAECQQCEADYRKHLKGRHGDRVALKKVIEQLQKAPRSDAEAYVISKSWVTQFKKAIEHLEKELTGNGVERAMERYFEGTDSPFNNAFDKLDPAVNTILCCPHSKLRKGHKRSSQLISKQCWSSISQLFPAAQVFSGSDEACRDCEAIVDEESDRKDVLRAQRDKELESPALLKLVSKLKKVNPYYPGELDDEDCAGTFALIDSSWLRRWLEYVTDSKWKSPPPGDTCVLFSPFAPIVVIYVCRTAVEFRLAVCA